MDEDILEQIKDHLGSRISEEDCNETSDNRIHPFAGINMVDFNMERIESECCEVQFVFSNVIKTILIYTKDVLTFDIHTMDNTTNFISDFGTNVRGTHQLLIELGGSSSFNPDYGF